MSVKLQRKVKNVLKRQVQAKGYEVSALLFKKEGNYDSLGICEIESSKINFSIPIKIIITSREVEIFPMEIGDNPNDILDFIWIEDENIPDDRKVNEACEISYMGSDYIVTSAGPTCLGGCLIIKECRAKKVR